jgi:hypothetical protein
MLKKIAAGVLAAYSVYLLWKAFLVVVATGGLVQGSEFSMLITLANLFGLFLVWVVLYTFWRLLPE